MRHQCHITMLQWSILHQNWHTKETVDLQWTIGTKQSHQADCEPIVLVSILHPATKVFLEFYWIFHRFFKEYSTAIRLLLWIVGDILIFIGFLSVVKFWNGILIFDFVFYRKIDGHSDKHVVIYGIVWMSTFQPPAYCIYAAFQLIGKFH